MNRDVHVRICVRLGGKFPGSTRLVGSEKGGKAAATLLSLIQTCRHLKVNPREYIEDVMRRIMDHPVNKLEEFLPDEWAKRRKTQTSS